jgi:hypothetical protein
VRGKIIGGAVLILGVFLAGFIPQFTDRRRLQGELDRAQAQLSIAQRQTEIGELQELAGRMLLEATSQNYGIAREHSTAYFDKARNLADRSDDASLKASLSQLLSLRDSITGGLAQGDPSTVSQVQSLLKQTYDIPAAGTAAP